jgi:hypothetical protein
MSQFEQDIRTSLNTIQTQLAAVQNRADGANASIARMGTTAKVAAGGVGDIERSMGKVTTAATRAGGPIAGMISSLGGLAAFNPLALAAGAAIGGITAGVYALIAALREASAEQEKLNATVAAAPGMAKAAGVEALAGSDPNKLRYGVSTSDMERNLAQFQKGAPGVKLTEEQKLQVSLGMGDADPAEARNAILRMQGGKGGRMADEAERIQRDRAIAESGRQERLLRVGSGEATAEERYQSAVENSPELKKSIDDLNDTMKKQRPSGWQFLGSEERAEASVRETQERIMTIRSSVSQSVP